MVDVDAALDAAGLTNPPVREFVRYWAALRGAERIDVIGATDDARLLHDALQAGEILPAGDGRYYSRSYIKDTARSVERTVVATDNPADNGTYNNWRPTAEMRPLLEGADAGGEGSAPDLSPRPVRPDQVMRARVHVRPRAANTRVGGSYADALVVRVTERAVDGKATAAALATLAKSLNLRTRDVRLVTGHTSRTKIVEIPDDVTDTFARLRDTAS